MLRKRIEREIKSMANNKMGKDIIKNIRLGDEFGLGRLKKDYEKLKGKWSMPAFSLLNQQFEIERISEHETDMLLREIRKAITEKAVAFLRFLEILINPTNAPFFIFALLKNMSPQDKKLVERIYEKLCEYEIAAISLDLFYDEKAEAKFIKESSKKWQDMNADLKELSAAIHNAWKASSEKKEKNYFG